MIESAETFGLGTAALDEREQRLGRDGVAR
jgi:hypothetical protein